MLGDGQPRLCQEEPSRRLRHDDAVVAEVEIVLFLDRLAAVKDSPANGTSAAITELMSGS